MSDKRISELVELTSLAADDELPVVDADANATKRITAANLSKFPSNITIPNGGTIGSASDADAITIDATGNVAISQALQLGDSTAISRLGADQFRLTADATSNGILTAWERVDEPTSGKIGTGVTESGGTFNVPNNGIWLIAIQSSIFVNSSDNVVELSLEVNANNATFLTHLNRASGNPNVATLASFSLHDLESTDDVTLVASSISSGDIQGRTDANATSILFLRLGDA